MLFTLDGDDRESLTARLRDLDAALDQGEPLHTVAARTFAAYRGGKYAVGIVGQERDAIRREIQMALKGIPHAFERGGEWQTPAGSYFTAAPQGQTGGVAFVYPGAFNSYPDLGRDWLYLFPGVYDHLATMSSDISRSTAERLLYPRHLSAPTRADIKADRAALANNPPAMMESARPSAVLYYVMRECSRSTGGAFGYSRRRQHVMAMVGATGHRSERFGRSVVTSRLRPKTGARAGITEARGQFWASYC